MVPTFSSPLRFALLPLCSALACSGRAGNDAAPALPLVPLPQFQTATDAALEGTVRDANGAPLAGAQVCAWDLAADLMSRELQAPVCAITSAAGGYVLGGLVSSSYRVTASAPTFQPADHGHPLALRAGERLAAIDLVLGPGGAPQYGVVVDARGKPIEGATVFGHQSRDLGGPLARSDGEGRFTLWVGPGVHSFTAQADGFISSGKACDPEGPAARLVLLPESVLRGQVVDARTRAPVPGARVHALLGADTSSPVVGVAYSDASGRFEVRRLPPGRYGLRAETGNRRGHGDRLVVLGLGQTSELPPIGLASVPGVGGRITIAGAGATGSKAADLARGVCPGGRAWLGAIEERPEPIDADGAFFFPAVEPGEYELHARCPGLVAPATPLAVKVEQAPVAGLTLQFQPGRSLTGTIVDDQGRPLPGASVSAWPGEVGTPRWGGHDDGTDGAGRFEIPGLAPGAYQVSVDGRPGTTISVDLTDDRDVGEIRVATSAGGEIRGVVVDARDAPTRGAQVSLHDEHGNLVEHYVPTTAETGKFVIRGVRPGGYALSAWLPGDNRVSHEPEVPGENVQVLTGQVSEVRLALRDVLVPTRGQVLRAGAPVADAVILAKPTEAGAWLERDRWGRVGSHELFAVTDPGGRFTLPETFQGFTYTIRAYPPGGGDGFLTMVDAGSEPAVIVPEPATLAGTITGQAPPVFSIALVHGREPSTARIFRYTDGRWGFTDLAPGNYTLALASRTGYATAELTLGASEQREEVPLTLLAPGGVRGRVIDGRGAPVEGVWVRVEAAEPGMTEAVRALGDSVGEIGASTASDGSFEFTGVWPGKTWVGVSASTRGGHAEAVVEPGRMSAVTVELR